MISPLVRRRRLADELVRLREANGLSSARLAAEIGVARQRVSRLENGHVSPDLEEMMRILTLYGVDQARWDQLMTIARDAQQRGWWHKHADEMGQRQALYADLEAGACDIAEYQMVFLPGLLQIPLYTEARSRVDRPTTPGYDAHRALEARAMRQQMLHRAGGPRYQVVIDELAIRRHAAGNEVVAAQLDHLADIGRDRDRVTIRVLLLDTRLEEHAVPRSAFFVYRYPDPGDPVVVAVDTVTDDLILTQENDVAQYLTLYRKLEDAALTPADSLSYLASAAARSRKGNALWTN